MKNILRRKLRKGISFVAACAIMATNVSPWLVTSYASEVPEEAYYEGADEYYEEASEEYFEAPEVTMTPEAESADAYFEGSAEPTEAPSEAPDAAEEAEYGLEEAPDQEEAEVPDYEIDEMEDPDGDGIAEGVEAPDEMFEEDAFEEDAFENDASEDDAETPDGQILENAPSVIFEESTEEVRVTVVAGLGVFPEGTTMEVKPTEDEETISKVSESVEDEKTKVTGVKAVDVTFYNAEHEEIEPNGPVFVTLEDLTKLKETDEEAPDQKPEDAKAVHVTDEGECSLMAAASEEDLQYLPMEWEGDQAEDSIKKIEQLSEDATVAFLAESFSTYALVYTVDFYWEVNGQIYEYSLAGGDSVSFRDLVQMLHIINTDEIENHEIVEEAVTEDNGSEVEDAAEPEESVEENTEDAEEPVDEVAEESADEVVEESAAVELSDKIDEFINDIEKIEFSDENLVYVAQITEENSYDGFVTAGELKEMLGLECEYSAEMTENQLKIMNEKEYAAPDWALISLRAFDTEESLIVTMKNGESFEIKVTDGQLHKYVISDSGDMYEVIVTYDDTAEIPEDAELKVTQITADTDKYVENFGKVSEQLSAMDESTDFIPVQFSIDIVSNGEVIEPKKGSVVDVEIKLVKYMFEDERESAKASSDLTVQKGVSLSEAEEFAAENMGQSCFMFDGDLISADITPESADITDYGVAHLSDDGNIEIIGEPQKSIEDDQIIMQFKTESFSDYMIMGWFNGRQALYNELNKLPSQIYVGDEIYMWWADCAWVTEIDNGSGNGCVSETKHNSDQYKSVRALRPGTFRITYYGSDRDNDWNNGQTGNWGQYGGKYIQVLPERAGTTPPRVLTAEDGIVKNSDIGLTLNLFDYDLDDYLDDRFNNYDLGWDPNGTHNPTYPAIGSFLNHGINENHDLKFWGSGITNGWHGALNNYVEHGVTSILEPDLVGGYPKLDGYSDTLKYLFNPAADSDDRGDRRIYTNVDGLFRKVGDYYIYDSNTNYAYYNESKNRFDVYDGTYEQKSRADGGEDASFTNGKPIGFFPFHKWDNEKDLYVNWDKNLNHHFGLSMSVEFALPRAPKAVKDTNGNDVVFEFSGDDDMWVFIDGKLAMDIGGIHQPTSGTINFRTGEVIVNGSTQMSNSDFTSRFPDLYDGNKHTLQVFYIERGGCDSNCSIMFNITRYGDVDFDKVDAGPERTQLEGAVFALYKDPQCTQPLMEQLNNGTSRAFVKTSLSNGHVKFDGIPVGTYYMKEIDSPPGYPIEKHIWTIRVESPSQDSIVANVFIDDKPVTHGTYGNEVQIENEQPEPIDLGLKKVWTDPDGNQVITPPNASATFEIKRKRSYETYTQTEVTSQSTLKTSKLKVGYCDEYGQTIPNTTVEEYDLISGFSAVVSWVYQNYSGERGCYINGVEKRITNSENTLSQVINMPADGSEARINIITSGRNNIKSHKVEGRRYIGNSGGGLIQVFTTVTEPDPSFRYTSDPTNVINNQVTLPIGNLWEYNFENLPLFGEEGEGSNRRVYNYSYYLEEVSCSNPSNVTVKYEDSEGNEIINPSESPVSNDDTWTITNKINVGSLLITKNVFYNNSQATTDAEKSKVNGEYKFAVKKGGNPITGSPFIITVTDGVSNSVLIPNLEPGDYTIEETSSGNLEFTRAEGGKSVSGKIVTVTVKAGDTTAAQGAAQATFNNTLYETDIEILKIDEETRDEATLKKLSGAKFQLLKWTVTDSKYIPYGDIYGAEDGVAVGSTEPNLGKLKFENLPDGEYKILETKAPDGYNMLVDPIYFQIDNGITKRYDSASGTSGRKEIPAEKNGAANVVAQISYTPASSGSNATFTVGNTPGEPLPATGGPGTRGFLYTGLALIFLAALFGLAWRRKRI